MSAYEDVFCKCGERIRVDLMQTKCDNCGRKYAYSDNPVGKIVKLIVEEGDEPMMKYYYDYKTL